MDDLERLVQQKTYDSMNTDVYAERAKQAWVVETGLNPSYVEVLRLDNMSTTYPMVVVEVDGIRIWAFREHSYVRKDFHQWHIAESNGLSRYKISFTQDFTLAALEPFLSRRRKRLRKRGLYNG